jgi:hypothetical protein
VNFLSASNGAENINSTNFGGKRASVLSKQYLVTGILSPRNTYIKLETQYQCYIYIYIYNFFFEEKRFVKYYVP